MSLITHLPKGYQPTCHRCGELSRYPIGHSHSGYHVGGWYNGDNGLFLQRHYYCPGCIPWWNRKTVWYPILVYGFILAGLLYALWRFTANPHPKPRKDNPHGKEEPNAPGDRRIARQP